MIATARSALKSLHAAERGLLRARHKSEVDRALKAASALTGTAIGAQAQGITAHYAAKIAALSSVLTNAQRAAAIGQLKLEEAAELGRMYIAAAAEGKAQRRAAMVPIRLRHKGERGELSRRQRAERSVLAVVLRPLRAPRVFRDRGKFLATRGTTRRET